MILSFKLNGRLGKSKTLKVHRLVAEAFIDLVPNKNFVNHKDGIKINNNANNLEWVTKSENSIHALANGLITTTFKSGDNHVSVKLSSEEVIKIRQIYVPRHKEFGARALGRKYNVDHSTIVKIANGSERLNG